MMETLLTYLVPILIGLVSVALILGLINMGRGGSPGFSQKMMRWRVGLQFVAIVLIITPQKKTPRR